MEIISNWTDYGFLLITVDQSIPEFFQYVKYLLIIVLLIKIIHAAKRFQFISWAFFFLILFVDDSIGIHENAGIFLSEKFNFNSMFGLRAEDIGELLYTGLIGFIIIIAFVASFLKGDKMFKRNSIDLSILIFFFLLFGVGFDMLHQILSSSSKLNFLFGMIEDGGEMIMMSIILWYIYHLSLTYKKDRTVYLHTALLNP
ncbi:hypothetical protein [Maribacter sp. 2210JD10-5]|uniref:hypothetical protein n=1 Tax=Maribacter sp. 2210JD10-5 TaxID=3386272 RepID=UPI0039BD7855